QLSWLSGNTSLISFTIGGNENGFPDGMQYRAPRHLIGDPTCQQKIGTYVYFDILRISSTDPTDKYNLPPLFASIKAATPATTRVLVVGYPRLFPVTPPMTCGTGVPTRFFQQSDMVWINSEIAKLNIDLKLAATRAGFVFVSTYNAFQGHELCTP